jgi:hypothetical protein
VFTKGGKQDGGRQRILGLRVCEKTIEKMNLSSLSLTS